MTFTKKITAKKPITLTPAHVRKLLEELAKAKRDNALMPLSEIAVSK